MLNKEPKSWGDITVNQFIELSQFNIEDFSNEDELNLYYLSLLTDTSSTIIEDLPFEKFESLLKQFEFVKRLPIRQPSQLIQTPAGPLYYIQDFNQLEIGAFIDLEHFITNDHIANLKIILSIFYRQKTIHNSPLILDEFEPYGNWIYKRAELFDDISIAEVYQVIPLYFKFREEFFKRYDGLLGGPVDEDDDEPIQGESIIARSERIKQKEKEKSIQKWGWDLFLYQLANNDISKINQVTNTNIIQAFNLLSMKRELGL